MTRSPRALVAGIAGVAVLLTTVAINTPAAAAPRSAMTITAADAISCVTNPATPKRQFRAMWIASVQNLDWPNSTNEATAKAQFEHELDYAVAHDMNAVIVQVRPTADAFWPSAYEPWSGYLIGVRGQDPGWDPLAFMVDAAHQRNLEFHAWFNPYRVSMPAPSAASTEAGADINKLAPTAPLRQHPDWGVVYPVGVPTQSRLYYNPGIPEVRHFVEDAIMDAVTKYDIDGVHFDDYFYPYPYSTQDFGDDATFAQYGAGFATKADWRRDNIDKLIQEMDQKIHTAKPWVKFGVSPFGIWRNNTSDPLGSATNGTQSYDANDADTRLWVKNGWIDYIIPQVYWNIGFVVADYAVLVPWWADVVKGTDVALYIGEANYKQGAAGQPAAWFDPAEMSKHLTFDEQYPEVAGNVFFREQIVEQDPLGSTTQLVADHYTRPAIVPTMPGSTAKPLMFPVVTKAVHNSTGGVDLTWHPTASGVGPFGAATSYAVYRFDGMNAVDDCDTADASHLVATIRGQGDGTQHWTDTTAVAGTTYTYVVSALDRTWHESPVSPPAFVRP